MLPVGELWVVPRFDGVLHLVGGHSLRDQLFHGLTGRANGCPRLDDRVELAFAFVTFADREYGQIWSLHELAHPLPHLVLGHCDRYPLVIPLRGVGAVWCIDLVVVAASARDATIDRVIENGLAHEL